MLSGRGPGSPRTIALLDRPKNADQGIDQVWVPGGVFRMGSDEASTTPPSWASAAFDSEHPAHDVAITRGFWIDLTAGTVDA